LLESVKVKHYKDLIIWQKGMDLARRVYQLTTNFPPDERFGLVGQMRRAAVSVPSNIAEGQARHTTKEFLLFLSHAGGSLAELETQLLLSVDLGYCSQSRIVPMADEVSEIQRMLAAIRRKLVSVSSH
jgi:four helix bundle protein